uniref:CRAL-TRIO domain-containing protein n=1 Tax=Arcella intermedia TaxID=1963864 RepID=A0A6B2LEG1_9EUKA
MFPQDLEEAVLQLEKIVREEAEKQGIDLTQLDPNMDLDGPRKELILARYIRARGFRVEDTKAMIMTSIKWRLQNQPYKVSIEDIIIAAKRDYCFFHDFDRDNNPIVWVNVQFHLDYANYTEIYQKFVLFMMEEGLRRASQILESTENREKFPNIKATLVFDMKGFSMANMDFPIVKFLAETLQAHYPDVLAHTYIVDSPWIFSTCWAMIKGWLDPVVVSKIEFLDRQALLKAIPPEKVPVVLGGKSVHKKMWE